MSTDDPRPATTCEDPLAATELDGDRYTVVRSFVRNRYRATDADGNVVLRGKQKMFGLKEEFPFVDADDRDVLTVKAGGILDVADNDALVDAVTDGQVVVLDTNWTLFVDRWELHDTDTEAVIATIESTTKLVAFLRRVSGLFSSLPHECGITAADGDRAGTIEGRFSLRDVYDITIDDASDVPRSAFSCIRAWAGSTR